MLRRFSLFRSALMVALLLLLAAGGYLLTRPDPRYTAEQWASLGRFSSYDTMIEDAARKHQVDPLLIRAVVWQESRFHEGKTGKAGERGLMQVGEMAASDWVRIFKIETFTPTDLFSPRMNLEIGTWYLSQALKRWKERDNPIPFALAEYNAGKRRVDRWIAESGEGDTLGAERFLATIDFPTTRAYIEAITSRHAYYRQQQKERQ